MSEEVNFNFSVVFDSEKSLKSGKHHIVTPVQLLYYKEYRDDDDVITKGAPFFSPLQTVVIDIEIPGGNVDLNIYFTSIITTQYIDIITIGAIRIRVSGVKVNQN